MAMNRETSLNQAGYGALDYSERLAAQNEVCATAVPPKTMTPIDRVALTLSETRDLSSRVRIIVDNLVGAQPEKDGAPGRSIGGGILTSLADNAEDTLSELRRANDELSRLSKVLGLGL